MISIRARRSAARRAADALGMGSSLVRYNGGEHTACAKTTDCIQDVIETYLFDLRLPEEGFACPGRTISFGSAAGLREQSGAPAPDFWRTPAVPHASGLFDPKRGFHRG